ncbi:extracelular serine carboxypeptidase [Exophiala viscosa]|uniref:Extracelular serine carboxypeptidase n=1 Tax=Exophiala viscosa TaxID=2486360 RepID=A0AAN6DS96_9EURO|nr:extracelular serine carboxypeptidase [Exophiala viscosa]
MKHFGVFATAVAALAGLTTAQVGPLSTDGRPTTYYPQNFTQLIDHYPHSPRYAPNDVNGTFTQRYFIDNTYYEPGGPIFLYIGGETSGESRFSNLQTGIIQILMNATNGLGIILENRYYGESWPYENSSTDNLRYLTTEQTIADNAYFAQNVVLPANITNGANLSAPGTPWILYGGSLAGAQTAFSLVEYSGLLWGGIAASGVIHAVHGYPEWYNPIQKNGPSDCITRINNIVDKMDSLIRANNAQAIQQLKEIFGLGSLSSLADFAMTIAFPLGGPDNYPWIFLPLPLLVPLLITWQELNWYPVYDAPDFFDFCNNITDLNAPANITAVDTQLSNYTNGSAWTGLGAYANYVKNVIVSTCPSEDLIDTTTCFSTQNETYWADVTNSALRSYTYSTCIEQGAYQLPQPSGTPSLLSRAIDLNYTQQWCTWAFSQYASSPQAVPSPSGPNLTWYNKYGDFNLSAPRLALIDGGSDVWRDVCYHGHNASTRYGEQQMLITGGGHHWDSYGILNLTLEPDFIRAAHQWEIRHVLTWMQEWNQTQSSKRKRDEL